jgi:hypothetical protein
MSIIQETLGYPLGGVRYSDVMGVCQKIDHEWYVYADGKWWNAHRLTIENHASAQSIGETVFGLRWEVTEFDEPEILKQVDRHEITVLDDGGTWALSGDVTRFTISTRDLYRLNDGEHVCDVLNDRMLVREGLITRGEES